MDVKLASALNVENFQEALRSEPSWRKLYIVTRPYEYNNVPRTVLEVFSPFLASLLSSMNSPEETPTIILSEVKSVTLKHLVDLLQDGAIQLSGPTGKRRKTIVEIVELANILNIEMNNLTFDEEDFVPKKLKQEPVRMTDPSDELLLFEENLFCQQLLKKEYLETEQPTGNATDENMVNQEKEENTTEEYFENLTIGDHQVKIKNEDQEEREDELVDTNALREEGELSEEEDEYNEEVFTLHCRRCRFVCRSRRELEKHSAWYHREERKEGGSPAYKRSRYSTSSSSSYQKYSSSADSPYKPFRHQHRYKTLDCRTRFHK